MDEGKDPQDSVGKGKINTLLFPYLLILRPLLPITLVALCLRKRFAAVAAGIVKFFFFHNTSFENHACVSFSQLTVIISWKRYLKKKKNQHVKVRSLLHFPCSFAPSGPPVIVGMSINIASIDSISEVNMVSYVLLGLRSTLCLPTPHPPQATVDIICVTGRALSTALLPSCETNQRWKLSKYLITPWVCE